MKKKINRACIHCLFLLLLSALMLAGCTVRRDKPEQKIAPAGGVPGETTAKMAEAKPMESGAAYFQQYYAKRAAYDTAHDDAPMGLDAWEAMASSTVGTVVDTEVLRIEVLGALFSGNTAEIALRVTAKELESVLNDDEEAYFSHYQFGDETARLFIPALGGRAELVSFQYTYCDTDESLAPNQFLLHYWIISPELVGMEVLSIPLQGLGRIGGRRIELLYEGSWQVDIAVDPASDSSKQWTTSEEIQLGENRFAVEEIQITPLSCTVHLRCLGESAYLEENENEIIRAIADGYEDFQLNLADGTSLVPDPGHFYVTSGEDKMQPDGVYDAFRIYFRFDSPMAVESIASLDLFGNVLSCE